MPGVFISFEGGEGSGKTTQIGLLENWLNATGEWPGKVTCTREPGGTPEAERIRDLLVKGDADWDGLTEALLMTAARRENTARIIAPALERGDAVLTDRFFDSTTVYQAIADGADRELVDILNARFLDGVAPDITVLLDIDPAVGLERSGRDGNDETRFESKGLEFHLKVRQGFLDLAKDMQDRFLVVGADRNESEVHEEIVDKLKPRLERYR